MSAGHRIALDAQALQSRTFGERGIARWVRSYVEALVLGGAPVEQVLLNPHWPRPVLPAAVEASGLVRWHDAAVRRAWRDHDVAYHVLSPFERGRPVDATLPSGALHEAGTLVVTLFDAIPFALAGWYLADDATRRFMEARRALLLRADLVLAISRHARTDGIELLGLDPDRVVTIGSGGSAWFTPAHDGDDPRARVHAALPALRDRYVFTVAGWLPHKNPLALVDAWGRVPAAVRAGRQLAVTCAVPVEAHGLVAARVAAAGLAPDEVVVTGQVDDELLRDLYRGAELFVLASLYEGFGLPVLEAARCGTPAVTSSTTATPEVLDHPAATFDATDPDDMARVITAALTDPIVRAGLLAAAERAATTHTWAAVADRATAAYARLPELGRPRAPRRRRPPAALRVALTGPLLPAPSGVAAYSSRVAAELGRRVALDCFAELAPWQGAPRPHRQLPIGAFGSTLSPYAYDTVVHVLGNSTQHAATLAAARRFPGVTWLHEVDLGALGAATDDPEPAELGATLAAAGRGVLVSTRRAADQLAQALGPGGPPVEVVPLAVPTATELALVGDVDDVDPDRPWVVCFGIVDPAKQPDAVLAAVAVLAARRAVRLAFVGPADEPHRSALLARAAALGLAGQVHVTGHVTGRDYGRWWSRAAVAVQLRAVDRGEASATVVEAIGAGVPVITSVASADELPDGVAELVTPYATPHEVAERLAALLPGGARRAAAQAAQAAYAPTWGTAAVADRLAALLADPAWQGVGGAGGPTPPQPVDSEARKRT